MTAHRVICNRAPLGYERYQGMSGHLILPRLPQLSCTFSADDGEDIVLADPKDWSFEDGPTVLRFDADKHMRLTDVEHFRSLVGKRVRVVFAPPTHEFWVGKSVTAEPDPSPDGLLSFGHGVYLKKADQHLWELEELPASPADSQYNATDFERDLDEAISEARLMAETEAESRLFFRSGELDRALGQVMAVLAWRALSERDKADACDVVWRTTRNLLIQKNAAYGDSALNPVRVFSSASPMEQLLVRLDDKVSRLQRGHAAGEDVASDMLGYLLLTLIARKRESRVATQVGAQKVGGTWVGRRQT